MNGLNDAMNGVRVMAASVSSRCIEERVEEKQ
jgi:hypothetical protein